MVDILGPASAPNAVTTRPSEGRSFGSLDSWFKDCSSDTADDGTDIEANWLNGMIAALRAVWRGNGMKADGVTPVVAEVGTDDYGLLTSMSHLIQRGQARYGRDTGAANAMSAAMSPACVEYKEGMVVHVRAANTQGAGATLKLDSLPPLPIIRPDGSPLRDGDIVAGSGNGFFCDGTHWQVMGADAPPVLKRALTYYVNGTTGDDSYDGTTAAVGGGHGPFRTLQGAVNAIAGVNLNGYDVTVWCTNSAYPSVRLLPVAGSGRVYFIGDQTDARNCVIAGNGVSAVLAQNCGAAYCFDGFSVQSTGAYTGDQLAGFNVYGTGTKIELRRINFGQCGGAHIFPSAGAQVDYNGPFTMTGGCTGNPGAPGDHIFAYDLGQVNTSGTNPPPMTIYNAVSFAGAWAHSLLLAPASVYYSALSGANLVSGQKFNIAGGAGLNTGGNGLNYLPGTIPGVNNGGFII